MLLAVTVLTQACLISWAAMWPMIGPAYIFSNFGVIGLGIHSLANPANQQTYIIFITFLTFSILYDILCWAAYFPDINDLETIQLISIGVSAVSIIAKPYQACLLWCEFRRSKQELRKLFGLDRNLYETQSALVEHAEGKQPLPRDSAVHTRLSQHESESQYHMM
mmetsp:Transcript_24228/g.36330  ORF Transcript_24228/g.36330 Transcript_24228/m.36330 type:complete len:165 (+) Transcript_24228:86-580(+)